MTALKSTLLRLLPHLPMAGQRPWKIALYLGMFLLPGGTLGILALAWLDHQLMRRQAARALPVSQTPATLETAEDRPGSLCHDCPAM